MSGIQATPSNPATPTAYLCGTDRQPEAWLFFDRAATHAAVNVPLVEWVKAAPSRRWNAEHSCWIVTAFGRKNPDSMLVRAGFRILIGTPPPGHGPLDPSIAGALGFADYVRPLVKQSAERPGTVLVRPRFAGWEVTRDLLGEAAVWDKKMARFEAPLTAILDHGDLKKGFIADAATVEAARAAIRRTPAFGNSRHDDATILRDAAKAAYSSGLTEMGHDTDSFSRLVEVVGDVPDWFGMDLYPYQRVGSVAVAAGRSFLADPTGLGKGSPASTRILTPTGWTTYGQIQVGDQVVGSDGRAITVTGVFPRGALPVYRVSTSDGCSVLVDGDHLWTHERGKGKVVTTDTRSVKYYLEGPTRYPKPRIPVVGEVAFAPGAAGHPTVLDAEGRSTHAPLPVHPYQLGVLLARGSIQASSVSVMSRDADVVQRFADLLPPGCTLVEGSEAGRQSQRHRVVSSKPSNPMTRACRELGLMKVRRSERFIPSEYLWAGVEDRRELMRGLLDAGARLAARGIIEFSTVSVTMGSDVAFLARSLGYVVTVSAYTQPGGVLPNGTYAKQNDRIRIRLSPPEGVRPFSDGDERNAGVAQSQARRTIVSVEEEGVEEVICIAVDAPDKLYVTEDFIVTHNTSQAIAAMAIRDADRVIYVVPPVTITHWGKEIERCGLAYFRPPPPPKRKAPRRKKGEPAPEPVPVAEPQVPPAQNGKPGRELVIFRAGRKEPDLPERGVVVVPDSLLASRAELRKKLIAWRPDGFAYDEAHRARTWTSARARAARDITDSMGPETLRVAVTATPLFSNPAELCSLLAISGHLDPVFGGYSAFVNRFCKRNHFNALVANKAELPELRRLLAEHVWVRRDKAEVLPDLPKLSLRTSVVDVDLAGFRDAHNEVIDKISVWLDEQITENGHYPDEQVIETYARSQIGLMSPLRKAAGLAKVPVAMDLISSWIENEVQLNLDRTFTCDRPLLVWAHHKEVVDAMEDHARNQMKDFEKPMVRVISGATSAEERGEIVEQFQAAQIPILICSITAAGVGITLTRGSDQIFVESDYSPPNVSQAVDRQNRIGQTRPVTVTTLIAEGTLDARLQTILARKSEIIAEVQGDKQGLLKAATVEGGSEATPAEIIIGLVNIAIEKHRKAHRGGSQAAA